MEEIPNFEERRRKKEGKGGGSLGNLDKVKGI